MGEILLMRHGEADFSGPARWRTLGWGSDLAPLSSRGAAQVQAAVSELQVWSPTLIVSSPMTRALHTASIVASALGAPVQVEFDLHEWVPDQTFRWRDLADVVPQQEEFLSCGGEWPTAEPRLWEPLSSIKKRTRSVLERYLEVPRLLVVCHQVVMYSITGVWEIDFAQRLPYLEEAALR